MGARNGYLYKRKGSQNWWVRLQNTVIDGEFRAKYEKSLGTPDKDLAAIRAAALINEHIEQKFWDRQIRLNATTKLEKRYLPGKIHALSDGTKVVASADELSYYDQDDNLVRKTANEIVLIKTPTLQTKRDKLILDSIAMRASNADGSITVKSQYAILEKWFAHKNVSAHIRNEAIAAWDIFAKIVAGRRSTQWTRKDGRLLAQAIIETGNKSKTAEKKVGHLRAAVNIAIADGEMVLNPFVDVVPKLGDSIRREPLSDEDMALIKSNLHLLRDQDRLLWIWLATTGMRLSEPFGIEKEDEKSGVRCVVVGHKTPSSLRRLPIPDPVLSMLDGPIKNKIFSDSPETTAKRIRYFLKSLGISRDSRKETGNKTQVIHSLRHRAADRLREADCPEKLQNQIFGHEDVTMYENYGLGFSATKLKFWIDKIGY